MTTSAKEWVRSAALVVPLRAWFDAPIRTGFRIDMQRILGDGYEQWLALWDLDGPLHASAWRPAREARRVNQLLFDVDDYSGAGRRAHLAEISPSPDQLDRLAASTAPLQLQSVKLKLYDFGIVELEAVACFIEGPGCAYSEPLRVIEAVSSSFAVDSCHWVTEAITELRTSIPDDLLLHEDTPMTDATLSAPTCVPMWVHRLLIGRAATGRAHLDESPDHALFVQGEPVELWTAIDDCAQVWIGHGTSVLESGGEAEPYYEQLTTALGLANVFYAGAGELSNLMLRWQRDLAEIRRIRNSRELRTQALKLVEQHDQLTLFRTLLRDQTSRLPITSRSVFDAAKSCWNLDDLLSDVDQHRMDLAEIHQQSLGRVAADESGRLNVVVFGLTLISAIAVLTDLMNFVQESGFNSPDGIRLAIVAVMMLALLVLAFTTLRLDGLRSFAQRVRRRRTSVGRQSG